MNKKIIFLILICSGFELFSSTPSMWDESSNIWPIVPIQLNPAELSSGIKQMSFILNNSDTTDKYLRGYGIVGKGNHPVVNKKLETFVKSITQNQWAQGYYFMISYVQRSTGKVFLASELEATASDLSLLPIDVYLTVFDSSGVQVVYGKISDNSITAASFYQTSAAFMAASFLQVDGKIYQIKLVAIDPGLTGYVHDKKWNLNFYSNRNYSNPIFAICSDENMMNELMNLHFSLASVSLAETESIQKAGVSFSFYYGKETIETYPILLNSKQIKALKKYKSAILSYKFSNFNSVVELIVSIKDQPDITFKKVISISDGNGNILSGAAVPAAASFKSSEFIYKTNNCSATSVEFFNELSFVKSSDHQIEDNYSDLFSDTQSAPFTIDHLINGNANVL